MIHVVDEYILCDLLGEIKSPRDDQDFIPFVRFNSDQHFQLRDDSKGPYGAVQFLGEQPDPSRSARSARIWKWTDATKKTAKVDRYPEPVFLDYLISLYTEKNARNIAAGHMELIRRLPYTFYKTLQVDVFGDGVLVDKAIHFVRGDGVNTNPLDQTRQFQVNIPYTVAAWIFFHTPEDRATFWNRAEVGVCLARTNEEITPDLLSDDRDDLVVTP